MTTPDTKPRVALFVTCLVDLMRPSIGFAAVKLIEQAGCTVEVPAAQTCCGQPAYNSGDKATAAELARQTIAAFEGFDYVVAPSGSCAGMLKVALSGAAGCRHGLGAARDGICSQGARADLVSGRCARA